MDSKIIGNRIKNLRENLDLTQKELAQKLGLKGDTAIANYEAGYSIPKDEIKLKMCEIFNCSLDYLMCKSDIRNPKEIEIDTDKIKLGLSTKDYENITNTQIKQIEELAKVVLKDNLKKDKKN